MDVVLPRYFVARQAPEPVPPLRGPLLTHVLDTFRLGGRGRSQREVAVVADRRGVLHLVDDLPSLPPSLRSELSHHDLSGGTPRLLDVEELWLLAIHLLEQPGDTPGIDDPVYLYGRLFGPLPSPSPVMADGQLALTRSDLLDGVVGAASDAFVVGDSRCLHAVLAGERVEGISSGRGLVLAYPLAPPELGGIDASNEELAVQLLHDLLSATRNDARTNGIAHPLLDVELPVPSRAELERQLDDDGWDVQGDTAIRRSSSTAKGTIGGFLSQVLGVPDTMKQTLPPEATLDGLLAIARQALPGFPGFPNAKTAALRARTVRGTASRPTSPPRPPNVPRASAPRPAETPAAKTTDWMNDFVAEHGPRPRITRMEKRREPAPAPAADWMKDFDDE